MKTKKATVFWCTFYALIALYVFTVLFSESVALVIGPVIIGGLVFAGFGYQSSNVADNALKGHFYRPELDQRDEHE
jgi:hypothetical protein